MKCDVRLIQQLLDLMYPQKCILCENAKAGEDGLCIGCRSKMIPIHFAERMISSGTGETIFCIAPYQYQGDLRKAIIRFKFYGKRQNARFLGYMIAKELHESNLALQIDIATAVPISQQRLKTRGYNQAELIAKSTVKFCNFSYKELLFKTKHNEEQHKLDRKKRLSNVRGVYSVIDPAIAFEKRILLVDDIVTTGATMCECASTLLKAGAKSVLCAAVAKVTL